MCCFNLEHFYLFRSLLKVPGRSFPFQITAKHDAARNALNYLKIMTKRSPGAKEPEMPIAAAATADNKTGKDAAPARAAGAQNGLAGKK